MYVALLLLYYYYEEIIVMFIIIISPPFFLFTFLCMCVCVCVWNGISPRITIEHFDSATLIHAEDRVSGRYSAMQVSDNAAFSSAEKDRNSSFDTMISKADALLTATDSILSEVTEALCWKKDRPLPAVVAQLIQVTSLR